MSLLILPNGKLATRAGAPVEITQAQFEACCCDAACGCDDAGDADGGFTLVVNSNYGGLWTWLSGTFQLAAMPEGGCLWGQVVNCIGTGSTHQCFLAEAGFGSDMAGNRQVEVALWDMRLYDDNGTVRHVAEYPYTIFRKTYDGMDPIDCSFIELDEFDPETGESRPGTATLTATGPQTYDPESYLFDYLYLLPYEAPGCVPSQVAIVFNFNSAPMAQFGGWYTLDKVADSRPKWELATTINGFDCRFRLEPTASGVDFTFWVKCGSSPDVWDVLVWIALRADTTPTIGMDNWMTWYAECNYSDYGTSWFRSGIEDCNGTDFRSPWSGNEQVLIGAINDCG